MRGITGGVPIGAKIAAGMDIEQDITFLVKSGVDFIAIDGAEAATKGSSPTLQDDFGLPTVMALCRAVRQLEKLRARERVSLIVAGGLFTPGDFLKAMALGADAVYIGTAALFAVAHTQTLKALPYEPPTEVVWYTGRYASRFNVEQGAKHLGNFLKACREELSQGLQALGKCSLVDLSEEDLFGLSPFICEVTGVRPAWKPRKP
ncbi:MAG: Glutamate synthase (NADPH) large chain [Firmicutes bacterium]|nr:Glutamate synthase (NADPH) large chain [Bacillota bacterium]